MTAKTAYYAALAEEAAKQVTAKIRKAIPQTRINYLMLDYFRDSAEGCGMPHDIKF